MARRLRSKTSDQTTVNVKPHHRRRSLSRLGDSVKRFFTKPAAKTPQPSPVTTFVQQHNTPTIVVPSLKKNSCCVCSNCDRTFRIALSISSHFCCLDCKTAWSLRTGYQVDALRLV